MFVRFLKKKLHISWMVFWLSLGLILGVFFGPYIRFNEISLVIFGLTVSVVGLIKARIYIVPLVVIGGLIFGVFYMNGYINKFEKIDSYLKNDVVIYGKLNQDSENLIETKSSAVLDVYKINELDVNFKLKVTYGDDGVFTKNDEMVVGGVLRSNFGQTKYVIYDAKIIHHKTIDNLPENFKKTFQENIRNNMCDKCADLGVGFLLGEKSSMDIDFENALRTAGLTHIIVASGYNLTILVRLARRIFVKTSKYLALMTAFLMIFLFMLITGFGPSMVRAGIVSGLSLIAWYYGRKVHPVVLLAFVATLTLIYDPSYLASSVGWQLSFSAFAGVIILAPSSY